MSNVKIKATQVVQPAEPIFRGVLPLTEFERVVSYGSYIPWVYFYKSEAAIDHWNLVTSRLRESLSHTLVHFYPLTGRLVHQRSSSANDHRGGSVELQCGGGTYDEKDDDLGCDGAMFIVAESSSELADFGNFSNFYQFQDLIPSVDEYDRSLKEMHKVPLLLVQITRFRCGGFSLGISMSHAIVDGLSSAHFIKEWARIARGEPLETRPLIDRTILTSRDPTQGSNSAPECTNSSLVNTTINQEGSISSHQAEKKIQEPPHFDFLNFEKTTMVMLTLTKQQVEQLKTIAETGAITIDVTDDDGNNMAPKRRPYSRYEVITAHMWRCLCKAKGHDEKSDTLTSLGVVTDVRGRVRPPLPSEYFGNGILMVAAAAKAGEIISKQLAFTCDKLRQTINCITDDYIRSDIEYLAKLRLDPTSSDDDGLVMRTADGTKVSLDLSVTSWVRLPIYGMDFGWGKEICMRSGPTHFEGVTAIMPNEDDGSINIVVCYQTAHMENFIKHFYADIIVS